MGLKQACLYWQYKQQQQSRTDKKWGCWQKVALIKNWQAQLFLSLTILRGETHWVHSLFYKQRSPSKYFHCRKYFSCQNIFLCRGVTVIQVLIINSHSLEDLVGFLHYLIEDERNDFIWLDLKVDISVTSSLFLSLSGLSECLSQPQKSDLRPHFFTLSTVFLNFRPSAQTNLTALGLQIENIKL